MIRGFYKCTLRENIDSVPGVQTVRLPADWFEGLSADRPVFVSLYEWMLDNGRVPADGKHSIHNRTYVGEKIATKLLAAEKKRLRKALKIKGEELDEALGWSDLNSGPRTEIGGCVISGDVALVVPEASREALNEFSVKLRRKRREAHISRIKKDAAGATFYGWLISQVDRPDHVGDLARDIDSCGDFPLESEHYEEVKAYLQGHNACDAAHATLKDAWLEYFTQYPERARPYAWCDECGEKLEVGSAHIAWDKVSQDTFVLDDRCLDKYRRGYELGTLPLEDLDLEDLIEKEEIDDWEADKVLERLKLWGVLPLNGEGQVYFIRSEKTHEIKIGFTAGNIEKRMASLQTAHPYKLRLLALVPGTVDDERSLHERFGSMRLQGEWFRPHPDILAFISKLD